MKIAVFGAGIMGLGIAQTAVRSGMEVAVFDMFSAGAGASLANAKRILWYSLFHHKKDKTALWYRSNKEVDCAFSRVSWHNSENAAELKMLSECDAVIEAIFEDEDAKKNLFLRIEPHLQKSALLFSNTSTIQIAHLASVLTHPERFMGLHFFNPVPLMKPVEAIAHRGTSPETVAAATALADTMQKQWFLAPDIPGFLVNRLAVPMIVTYYDEIANGADPKAIDRAFLSGTWVRSEPALRIVRSLIASAEEFLLSAEHEYPDLRLHTTEKIDAIIRSTIAILPRGPFALKHLLDSKEAERIIERNDEKELPKLRFKMGPGQFTDLVGLDVALHCIKSFARQEPNYGWRVPKLLEEMVAAKKIGQKSGVGFYRHGSWVDVEVPDTRAYAIITFGDGEKNVLSFNVIKQLRSAFAGLKNREGVRAVFLRGRGENFANGADIKEFPLCLQDHSAARSAISEGTALMEEINNFPVPVIALVEGRALGGAYELALACDYIFAKNGSTVGLPEVGLGILPGWGGTQRLARRVGIAAAYEMIVTAGVRSAERPFVDRVLNRFPDDILDHFVALGNLEKRYGTEPMRIGFSDYAAICIAKMKAHFGWRILRKGTPPASFKLATNAIMRGNKKPLKIGLQDEWEMVLRAFVTDDAEEGIRAFLEKRKPRFRGR